MQNDGEKEVIAVSSYTQMPSRERIVKQYLGFSLDIRYATGNTT